MISVLLLACVVGALELPRVVLVGVTGGTGPRAVMGLLDTLKAEQLFALSRRPESSTCEIFRARGIEVVEADLDDLGSVKRAIDLIGPEFAYVHGTGGDGKDADTGETRRARTLAQALTNVELVCYNSAAANDEHVAKIDRIRQKRECEEIFSKEIKTICLRNTLFMEELWKSYTRPSILKKKKFAFSVKPDTPMYLTSVRDLGRIAAAIFENPDRYDHIIDVASDLKTPRAMAESFGVSYRRDRILPLVARLLKPELFRILQFYEDSSLDVDIHHLKAQLPPQTLTSFDTFLEETHWSDPDRSYETLVNDLRGD